MAFVFEEMKDEFKNDCVFVLPEVEAIVKSAVNEVMEDRPYDERVIKHDTNEVLNKIVAGLMENQKPFKYMITCVILPKFGTGIHTGNKCHWNENDDRVIIIRWENTHLHVMITVFGIGIFQSKLPVIDNIVRKYKRQGKKLIPLSKSMIRADAVAKEAPKKKIHFQ